MEEVSRLISYLTENVPVKEYSYSEGTLPSTARNSTLPTPPSSPDDSDHDSDATISAGDEVFHADPVPSRDDSIYYFAYGKDMSRIWLDELCPMNYEQIGLAKLPAYEWLVGETGTAKIVPSDRPNEVTYGIMYKITPHLLSKLETKLNKRFIDLVSLPCNLMTKASDAVEGDWYAPVHETGKKIVCRVGIGRSVTAADRSGSGQLRVFQNHYKRAKYNTAIIEGLMLCMPKAWINEVVRAYIPEPQHHYDTLYGRRAWAEDDDEDDDDGDDFADDFADDED